MTQQKPVPAAAASLDMDVMRGVIAIADTASVTQAAGRVGRTPAAVSMQLKKLEETLGQTLFERSRTGMRLTDAGERLLPHARRLVEAERAALDAFRQPELEGEVAIGIIDDFTGVNLTRMLAAFARSHPKVTVKVSMGPSSALAPRLERGELDIGVIAPGCAIPWLEQDRLLFEEPLVWVGRVGGEAWRIRPVPLAISDHGCVWRKQALAVLDKAGTPWRLAYSSEFYAAQKAAVAADLAIAPLPRSLIEPGFVQLGNAAALPSPGRARLAMRIRPDIEPAGCVAGLAARILETFGVDS